MFDYEENFRWASKFVLFYGFALQFLSTCYKNLEELRGGSASQFKLLDIPAQ